MEKDFFASRFSATGGAGEIVLAPPVPGDIIEFSITGRTIYAQSGAYLAGSDKLKVSTKGSLRAMLSGEGLFLQTISGTGVAYLSSYGAISEKRLGAGKRYIVDTGTVWIQSRNLRGFAALIQELSPKQS